MSEIIFDGRAHTITLRDRSGRVLGTGPANNRTDSHAALRFVANGSYQIQDARAPYRHTAAQDLANGEYGTQGIVRFVVPGHIGVGIHAGRETTPDQTPERGTGPDHVTMGCIRTNEEGMRAIVQAIRNDPLSQIQVQSNQNQRR